MALFEVGNMWSVFDEADRFVVLCSSTLDSEGHAILQSGIGKELLDRYPNANLPEAMGKFINERCGLHGVYGLHAKGKVGIFQDRRHYQEDVDTMCVGTACRYLRELAESNPEKKIHVEMPGKGSPYFLIQGPVELCPNNVTFWSRP